MALPPRKSRKQLAPKLSDIVANEKERMARNSAMFHGWLAEAKDG